MKTIVLPRQARDKRRESTFKRGRSLIHYGLSYIHTGILAFIHMEFRWHVAEPDGESTVGDVGCYFRFGLAHSADGGKSFQWVGYAVEPSF